MVVGLLRLLCMHASKMPCFFVGRALSAAAAATAVIAVYAAAAESPTRSAVASSHESGECIVTQRGAVGDNHTEDTLAVQQALDASECGTVVFPAPGRFLIRPVFFRRDNLHVVIEAGATVVAWPDVDTW